MARPKKELDKEQFEKLCHMHATQIEICEFFNVDENTLNRWCKRTYKAGFSQVFKQKRQGGKMSLRRKQWNLAEKNASMAIFLGKNYLGQSDNPNEEHGTSAGDEITINIYPAEADHED